MTPGKQTSTQHVDPEPFTWAAYAEYLDIGLEAGYRFELFDERALLASHRDLQIFIRHDIDFAPRWAPPMAEIERAAGVVSTYCFQPDSPNYSLADNATRHAVEYVLGAGHEIGLHFDATRIDSDDEVQERVLQCALELEDRFCEPVRAVSFHMPGRRDVRHIELPPRLINTYGRAFFEDIGYVSDSNQDWRGADLRQLLLSRTHRRLQLLIHPMWWRERRSTMLDKLRDLAAQLGVDLDELLTPEQRALLSDR